MPDRDFGKVNLSLKRTYACSGGRKKHAMIIRCSDNENERQKRCYREIKYIHGRRAFGLDGGKCFAYRERSGDEKPTQSPDVPFQNLFSLLCWGAFIILFGCKRRRKLHTIKVNSTLRVLLVQTHTHICVNVCLPVVPFSIETTLTFKKTCFFFSH